MTQVSGAIRFSRIFAEFPRGWGTNDSGIVENGNFQRLRWLFFGYFRDEDSVIIYSDMQSVVGFSVIPKCITLNDPDWLFHVKFCFRAGLAG